MNEEAEKIINSSLDGFQWILTGVALIVILYMIFKNIKKTKQ